MDNETAARIYLGPAKEALRAFPVKAGDIDVVNVSENVTFKVSGAADDAAYVLRLHRPGYHTFEELNSERAWTAALNAAGIAAPIGVPARAGGDYVQVAIPATGEQRWAGMLRWVDGEVLGDVIRKRQDQSVTEDYFRQLGALLAALHNQSSAWSPPAHFTRHHLDVDGLMGEAPFWGRFWEHPSLTPGEADVMLGARAQLRTALARYGKTPMTYGVIHADLHPFNLLVSGERLTVIDFDDMGFGWQLYDIAVALTHYRSDEAFERLCAALLEGYRTRRELSAAAEGLIPMFLLVRELAVIGWLHQRPEIDAAGYVEEKKAGLCARCAAFEAPI